MTTPTKDELLRWANANDNAAYMADSFVGNSNTERALVSCAAYLREQAERDPVAAFKACWKIAYELGFHTGQGDAAEQIIANTEWPSKAGQWQDRDWREHTAPRLDAGADPMNPETWR